MHPLFTCHETPPTLYRDECFVTYEIPPELFINPLRQKTPANLDIIQNDRRFEDKIHNRGIGGIGDVLRSTPLPCTGRDCFVTYKIQAEIYIYHHRVYTLVNIDEYTKTFKDLNAQFINVDLQVQFICQETLA